ncbi:MAG TPA: CDP-glycerol glycerophosphotransferase family protein, partial [Rhabdochlamydiaceae bacterium]
DTLIVCTPRDLFDLAFFLPQQLLKKRVATIWCPHGNSDKGQFSLFMEGLKNEEYAFLYGEKMVDFFKQKNVFGQLKAYTLIGNYRYAFYQKYKAFYDAFVPKDPFIFYAPTWQDVEKSTSYFDALPHLLSLPEHLSLVIKPHPQLPTEKIERPNTLILTDFPPIYPLLNRLDIYIGDMSSIGYDCLVFDKPMFFLNQNDREGLYLFGCGVEVKRGQYAEIGSLIHNHRRDTYAMERKKAYDYTFGPELSWEETCNRCKTVLQNVRSCTH